MKRPPWAIVVVCLLGLALCVLYGIVFNVTSSLGYDRPSTPEKERMALHLVGTMICMFTGLIGYWLMQRWGVIIYSLTGFFLIIVNPNKVNQIQLTLYLITLLVGTIYFSRMSWSLFHQKKNHDK